MKKITSIVLALVMILSVMAVGITSTNAAPTITIDLPEWEWIIETPTGDYVDMLDEPAQEDMTVLGYTSNKTISEDIDTVKIQLYHYDFDNPNWNPRENDPLVLEKEVTLSELSSDRVATYWYDYRDDKMVYHTEPHGLEFIRSARKFSIPYSIPSRSGSIGGIYINKDFMDKIYHDKIVEACGESKSFADWVNSQSAATGYSVMLAVSKDGENWLKFGPLNAVKAQIVGENQDTYSLRPGRTVYWDYSVKNLGSCYWMLTDDYSYANNGTAGALIPNSFLAKGTFTCYSYGNEVNYNSTEDELYAAYKNAPDEYKTKTVNSREGTAFELNASTDYIIESGNTGKSLVTLTTETANLRVTVPTVLPVSVDSDNNVTVATTAKIVNGSKGQVDVTNAVLSGNNSWTLAAFDTDFKKVPVDTKQYGFKLQGYSVPVSGNAYNNQFDTIDGGAALDLSYDANVAIQSEATKDAEIGNIVFTVAWHK